MRPAAGTQSVVKATAYFVGIFVGFWGLVFLIAAGAANTLPRLTIGIALLAAGLFIIKFARSKVPEQRIVHQVDLSGDVHAEQLKCKVCGAPLDKDSITVKAGGVFVDCPYCGTHYQIEEEPKW